MRTATAKYLNRIGQVRGSTIVKKPVIGQGASACRCIGKYDFTLADYTVCKTGFGTAQVNEDVFAKGCFARIA